MTRGATGDSDERLTHASDSEHAYVDPHDWSKLQRIRYLLDRWSDIFEPDIVSSLSTERGAGSGLDPKLPAMARHSSVVELERCLEELREREPVLHGHLKAFRCRAEWRQVRAKVKIKLQSGREDWIPGWKRERIVPSWISLAKVTQAERILLDLFQGDVFIPKDLWDGLTKAV